MAGDAPVNALFRQTGVIRAETLDEMFDLAGGARPAAAAGGRRVAILSDGGGPGILCAGACRGGAAVGASALRGDEEAAGGIFLSPSTTIGNPLELVFLPVGGTVRRAIETLLAADEVDAVIAIHTPFDANGSAAVLEAIRQGVAAGRAAGGAGKPVLACLVAKDDAGTPMALAGESIPTYAFPESAARVLGKVAAYAEWRGARTGSFPTSTTSTPASARTTCRRAIEERGAGWLSAEEATSGPRRDAPSRRCRGVEPTADETAEATARAGRTSK